MNAYRLTWHPLPTEEIESLFRKKEEAVQKGDFETAAKYRDQADALKAKVDPHALWVESNSLNTLSMVYRGLLQQVVHRPRIRLYAWNDHDARFDQIPIPSQNWTP